MNRLLMIVCVVLALLGCGAGETDGGTGGSTSASSGEGGSGGEGTTGTGGSSTASTGGSGPTCVVPGPTECGPVDPAGYPDPLKSYQPGMPHVGGIRPLPGRSPQGAAGAWFPPAAVERHVTAVRVALASGGGCETPDTTMLALWSEAVCGMPHDDPNDHMQSAQTASLAQEDLDGAAWLVVPVDVTIPAGESPFVALGLGTDATCSEAFESAEGDVPRSLWFGLVDNDCDGVTDASLGWARLDAPTSPGVTPWAFDQGFALVLSQ